MTILEAGATPRAAYTESLKKVRHRGLKTAALTNNFKPLAESTSESGQGQGHSIKDMFDVVVESSVCGLRKPDPAIYELVCHQLGVEPSECVFLDDIGANLKPAQAMGMCTIKVSMADQGGIAALQELEAVLGHRPLFATKL